MSKENASAAVEESLSPRERVALRVKAMAATGSSGEQIIQMIEQQTFAYGAEEKKLSFFHSPAVEWVAA